MEFVVREIIMIMVKGFKFEKYIIIDNYLVYYFFIKILFCIKNGFLKI